MNETNPLLGNSNVYNGDKRQKSDPASWFRMGVLVVSLVGIGIWIGRSFPRPSQNTEPSSPSPPPPATESTTTTVRRTRPFCRIYGDNLKFAGILQTSLGSPSEQWSHIPCYAQPLKSRLWAGQQSGTEAAEINGFGAPDAILRTDFQRPAFPNREPIVGFGAAFTEASSLNFQSLSDVGKERLMELLFGKTGIGYSIGG